MNNLYSILNEKDKKLFQIESFKKNEIIFHEDEECHYVGVVLSGTINITSFSLSGNEIIYNIINKDGLFGNNLIFSSSPFYKGNVISKENSKVALISKNNLMSLLMSNQEALLLFLKYQSDFGILLNRNIKLLSLDNAKERFLYYFQINDNKIEFKSISELAKTLYLQRETLSRLISQLNKDGYIKRNKHSLVLIKN